MTNSTLTLLDVPCACKGATDGGARCRKTAKQSGRCGVAHKQNAEPPTTVLVKCSVNADRIATLEAAGIKMKRRNDQQLDANHTGDAERAGRAAQAIRPTPDSGCQVFGQEGAQLVSGGDMLGMLWNAGLRIADMHMFQREGQNTATLVVTLSRKEQGAGITQELVDVAEGELDYTWQFVHVWANPPQDNGEIVATINCGRPMRRKSNIQLAWNDGFFGLTEA